MKWAPIVISGTFLLCAAAAAEGPQVTRISQFSGKAVPRFETLKFAAVNGRSGPSREQSVVWRYERKGLPLLIIKETRDWRRVRDPSGGPAIYSLGCRYGRGRSVNPDGSGG